MSDVSGASPKERLAQEIVLAIYPWIGALPSPILASVMEQIRQALAKYDVTDAK